MGCVQTKPDEVPSTAKLQVGKVSQYTAERLPDKLTSFLPDSGPLTAQEYQERLTCTAETKAIGLPESGLTIRYAFVSQRGYYPETPGKLNQDAVCVYNHFGNSPERVFMGVFDGHGTNGTRCAEFAKNKVPSILASDPQLTDNPEAAFHAALVQANNELHAAYIDDTMSGTTAIAAVIHGTRLCVANVGDSRAVLAERQGERLVAVPLSLDQTPFREDECERVKQHGARVMTLDQLEGMKDPNVKCWGNNEADEGDPPRLWAPTGMYPGTAFTRSLGDSEAEKIGVFAEPELTTRRLTAANPILILASDGVFEFLTSQQVVDMVAKHTDPQEAALAVTVHAYQRWLDVETRTDDISIIVAFLSGISREDPFSTGTTSSAPPSMPSPDDTTTLAALSMPPDGRMEKLRSKHEQAFNSTPTVLPQDKLAGSTGNDLLHPPAAA